MIQQGSKNSESHQHIASALFNLDLAAPIHNIDANSKTSVTTISFNLTNNTKLEISLPYDRNKSPEELNQRIVAIVDTAHSLRNRSFLIADALSGFLIYRGADSRFKIRLPEFPVSSPSSVDSQQTSPDSPAAQPLLPHMLSSIGTPLPVQVNTDLKIPSMPLLSERERRLIEIRRKTLYLGGPKNLNYRKSPR